MARMFVVSWTESYTYNVPVMEEELRGMIPNIEQMDADQIQECLDNIHNFNKMLRSINQDYHNFEEYEGMDDLEVSAYEVYDKVSENRCRAPAKRKPAIRRR